LFLPMLGAFHMHASKANQILVLAAWFVGASVLSTVSGMSGKGFAWGGPLFHAALRRIHFSRGIPGTSTASK
jgi:hypothetical protein